MRTIFFTIIGIVCAVSTVVANENEHRYLKIKLADKTEISYPPGIGFIAEDQSGKTILNAKFLNEMDEFIVKTSITLWVFTTWNDEPDTYELTDGKLIMETSNYVYNKDYDFGAFKKRKKNTPHKKEIKDENRPDENYGARRGASKGVYTIKERFFDYDTDKGYDVSLEFNNGVIFYYRDGKAEAWQNGKTLKIENKYLIYTELGILKLSYNPKNKEIWYVFEFSE